MGYLSIKQTHDGQCSSISVTHIDTDRADKEMVNLEPGQIVISKPLANSLIDELRKIIKEG